MSPANVARDVAQDVAQENDKIIATIGLENIVIVNTKDALLICHKDKSQEIKKILNKIEMKNK